MRKLLLYLVLLFAMLLSACSDDDGNGSKDTESSIIGKWASHSYRYGSGELQHRVSTVEFDSDGNGIDVNGWGDIRNFTYEIQNDTLIRRFSETVYSMRRFRVSRDTLFQTNIRYVDGNSHTVGGDETRAFRITGNESKHTLTFCAGSNIGSFTESGFYHGARFEIPRPNWLPNGGIIIPQGKRFLAWFGNDKKLYQYGEDIFLKSDMTFTAEISENTPENFPVGIDNLYIGSWAYFHTTSRDSLRPIWGDGGSSLSFEFVATIIDTISLISTYNADGTGKEYFLDTKRKLKYNEPFVWSVENGNITINFEGDMGSLRYRYFISENALIQRESGGGEWFMSRHHGAIPEHLIVD